MITPTTVRVDFFHLLNLSELKLNFYQNMFVVAVIPNTSGKTNIQKSNIRERRRSTSHNPLFVAEEQRTVKVIFVGY